MVCPMCEAEMVLKKGISKKNNKPYEMWKCNECEHIVWVNEKEISQKPTETRLLETKPLEVKPQNGKKPDEYVEGKKENTNLMCRKDLMVAVVNKWQDVVDTTVILQTFRTLWAEIAK